LTCAKLSLEIVVVPEKGVRLTGLEAVRSGHSG
jgi:hypothetical protein